MRAPDPLPFQEGGGDYPSVMIMGWTLVGGCVGFPWVLQFCAQFLLSAVSTCGGVCYVLVLCMRGCRVCWLSCFLVLLFF